MLIHVLIDDLDIFPSLAAAQKAKCHSRFPRAQAVKSVKKGLLRPPVLILHTEREVEQEGRILSLCRRSFCRVGFLLLPCRLRFMRRTAFYRLLRCSDLTRDILIEQLANDRRLA